MIQNGSGRENLKQLKTVSNLVVGSHDILAQCFRKNKGFKALPSLTSQNGLYQAFLWIRWSLIHKASPSLLCMSSSTSDHLHSDLSLFLFLFISQIRITIFLSFLSGINSSSLSLTLLMLQISRAIVVTRWIHKYWLQLLMKIFDQLKFSRNAF